MNKNTIKKITSVLLSSVLLMLGSITAAASTSENNIKAYAQLQRTTTVTIIDEKTGERTEYNIDVTPEITVEKNEKGEDVITEVIEVGGIDSEIMPLIDTSLSDVIKGYKGTVRLVYTNDGTYACLTTCSGRWERVSGSNSISEKSINFGQILGTNANSGHYNMNDNYIQLSTGFKPGKYGYKQGHMLGANINAKVAGSYINVTHNINM